MITVLLDFSWVASCFGYPTSFLIILNLRDRDFFYWLFWNIGLILKPMWSVQLSISFGRGSLFIALFVSLLPSPPSLLFFPFHMHCHFCPSGIPSPILKVVKSVFYYLDIYEFCNSKYTKTFEFYLLVNGKSNIRSILPIYN